MSLYVNRIQLKPNTFNKHLVYAKVLSHLAMEDVLKQIITPRYLSM